MKSERALIDWHTHVFLPEHFSEEMTRALESRRRHRMAFPSASYEFHEEKMREAGVEKFVVVALTSRHLNFSFPNEFIAEYVERHKERAVGFASVDPNDPKAVEQLKYAVKELHLKGVKLAPPYQAFHPHSDEAQAIYRAASDLGLVVMFHQGGGNFPRAVHEYANANLLDKVARDFPELKIIIAHIGQPWYFEVVPLLHKHPNVFTDIAARTSVPWQLYDFLLTAIDYGVTHKVLFGTDFPALTPKDAVAQFRDINAQAVGRTIPEDVIEEIMYQRPLSLLGLGD